MYTLDYVSGILVRFPRSARPRKHLSLSRRGCLAAWDTVIPMAHRAMGELYPADKHQP